MAICCAEWSSWYVPCAKAGSSDPVKGTCQRRSLKPTCCGQMMAWQLTGLPPACRTCLRPRPSCQGMTSPTTLPRSIFPQRSVISCNDHWVPPLPPPLKSPGCWTSDYCGGWLPSTQACSCKSHSQSKSNCEDILFSCWQCLLRCLAATVAWCVPSMV